LAKALAGSLLISERSKALALHPLAPHRELAHRQAYIILKVKPQILEIADGQRRNKGLRRTRWLKCGSPRTLHQNLGAPTLLPNPQTQRHPNTPQTMVQKSAQPELKMRS
jgi:hypothetical protein